MKFSDKFLNEASNFLKYIKSYSRTIAEQKDKVEEIYKAMENAARIHVYGKGRSGSAAASFALRLKHFGYNVYWIGDLIKEPINSSDILILFSGSGETEEIVDLAKRAKKSGAKVLSITSFKESSLGKNSDIIFYLPGGLEKKRGWEYLGVQLSKSKEFYGGGLFEVLAYLFQENLLTALGKHKKIPGAVVAERHERDEVI